MQDNPRDEQESKVGTAERVVSGRASTEPETPVPPGRRVYFKEQSPRVEGQPPTNLFLYTCLLYTSPSPRD